MKLEITAVQKLAKVLKILVTIAFVCNMVAILFVPFLAWHKLEYSGLHEAIVGELEHTVRLIHYDLDDGLMYFFYPLAKIWTLPYTAVLTVFLWLCGTCTAVILWQAHRVLDTVLAGETFNMTNSVNMKRAGICCLIISVAAFARLIWGFFYYKNIAPLLTYNALFVPVFLMGFLLCLVMSALFRQAAELKEENDLTI